MEIYLVIKKDIAYVVVMHGALREDSFIIQRDKLK